MKKILLFLSILSLALSSCQKEDVDEIFKKSPEERVSEQLNAVRADLMSHEMGWLTTYKFNEGKASAFFLIKFIDENRVEINNLRGTTQESGYVLNYTQQIDLVFDTHNFLAELVDEKLKADFRWELDKQEDGHYSFKSIAGKTEGKSELNIVKATLEKLAAVHYFLAQQEATRKKMLAIEKKIQAIEKMMKLDFTKSFFRNLEIDGIPNKYGYWYNDRDGKVIFSTLKKGKIVKLISEVTVNEEGFVLKTPLTFDGIRIEAFKYNKAKESFTVSKPEGIKASIVYSNNKPYAYPGGISAFFGNPKYFYLSTYSQKLKIAIDNLKSKDPYFEDLEIYIGDPASNIKSVAYYRNESSVESWINFRMKYNNNNGVDEVTFTFDERSTSKEAEDYYIDYCKLSFDMFWDKTFIIIPQEGGKGIILVRKDDPSIWMVAR